MGLEACHPALALLYFSCALFGALTFRHPVFIAITFVGALAHSLCCRGKRALALAAALVPCIGLYALYFGAFHHFGVTVLWENFIGNRITAEALLYGLALGCCGACTVLLCCCLFRVVTTDKVVYLLGRVSPRLSLFFAIAVRMIPRFSTQARRIRTARSGIGCGPGQGNALQRAKHALKTLYILIAWAIDAFATQSESMQCRGSSLRGRTAFSLYRFDGRDRILSVGMFACVTLTLVAAALGLTDMVYAPVLRYTPIARGDLIFCIGYAALCLMPTALELQTQLCLRAARKIDAI